MQDSSWRELYKAAVLEIDLSKMQARIDAAVATVQRRMNEVAISEGGRLADAQEMSDALQILHSLRKMDRRIAGPQAMPKSNSPQQGVL